MKLVHYFDYKSPYAYLAQEATFALAERAGVELDILPYSLHIPDFLGAAEVDTEGRVLSQSRNEHQWRRVRYSYMDCRREANRRGLTIRGPRKIFDSTVSHIGFLWAKERSGEFRTFHDTVYEKFWRHELDIEDPDAVEKTLAASRVEVRGFRDFLHGEGRRRLEEVKREAEDRGVFGVPGYLVGDELFWGAERLDRVAERLGLRPPPSAGASVPGRIP